MGSLFFNFSQIFFLLLRRVSKGAKRAVENSRGLLFDAYQEQRGEICWGVSRGLLLDVHSQKLNIDGTGDGAENGHAYKCKNRVSIAHCIGNSHQLSLKFGYVVKVTHYKMTYIREETMFLMEPIIKEAWDESVAHVRPYIREVVEAFSPQLRVCPKRLDCFGSSTRFRKRKIVGK